MNVEPLFQLVGVKVKSVVLPSGVVAFTMWSCACFVFVYVQVTFPPAGKLMVETPVARTVVPPVVQERFVRAHPVAAASVTV